MTNHKRSPGNGVAGPLIASLSALVLLGGVGWFVVQKTDTKATGQENPITSVAPASDDASSTTPASAPARTTPTPIPTPTRSTTAPSRGSTRTPTPSRTATKTPTPSRSTYTPKPRHTATPTPTPTKTRTTKPPRPSGGSGTVEQQVLTLTNQQRAKSGCGPLKFNKSLTKAAEAHAADMVAEHFFAHDSLDGRSPFDRMKAAGFRGGAMAENIAVGYTSASAVVTGWMNSPGHRANILNCDYTMIGIGYDGGQVKPEWGNGSWVQDFGG